MVSELTITERKLDMINSELKDFLMHISSRFLKTKDCKTDRYNPYQFFTTLSLASVLSGKRTVNVVPLPSSVSKLIDPPCFCVTTE